MASIKDVANRAGVAISTVSKVLNGYPGVSRETKDKVNQAIAELKFTPNAVAAALSSKHTGRVALLLNLSDKTQIVERYLWPRLVAEYRLDCLDYLCDPLGERFEHPESLRLEEDAVEELIRRCPEDGVRDLERLCRRLCESVISLYYADGVLVNSINGENLESLLSSIYYR